MIFSTETNKIDELIKKIDALKVKKQKEEDKKNEKNSKIETRISKHDTITKALTDKSYRNAKIFENKVAEIDREIERCEEEIKLEDKLNHKRASRREVKATPDKKGARKNG